MNSQSTFSRAQRPLAVVASLSTRHRRDRHVTTIPALVLAVLLAGQAHAATKTWDGGAATANWSDSANWNADGRPTSSDAVWLDNSVTNPVPQINALSGATAATLAVDGATAATFLNYGGSTPLVLNLYGASVNATNTGPLLLITANAPATISANKVDFRLQTSGAVSVAAGKTVTFNNCYLSQSGTRALTKTGPGTVAFGGSGSAVQFTGGLIIAEGTWNAGADTLDLPTAGIITFTNASGVPATITSGNSHSIAGLAGGNANSEVYVTGPAGLTITGAAVTTFSGRIRGATKFVYAGTGILTLNGNNSYTGPTTISSGTLALGASGSMANTPTLTIAAGATFDVSALPAGFTLGSGKTLTGAGTVVGTLTAATDSTVAPGMNGTGTLTVTGGFVLAAGAHLDLDLNGPAAYDAIVVTGGNVSLAGDLAGTTSGYTPAIGDTFYIVRNTGTGTTTGTLNGVGDGGKMDLGGLWFRVSFTSDFGGAGFAVGGSGNDVALQRIDDPSPSGPAVTVVGAGNTEVVQLRFSWQDNTLAESGYYVYRVLDDGSLQWLATLPANTTSFTENVANYASYKYAVQAFDAAGNLGDLSYSAPFQVGASYAARQAAMLDWLAADVPNLGQFSSGPHRIGRVGFWDASARMLHGDTATGISYITTAVEDASAENSNAGFSMWPGMDAYMRWNSLFPQSLKDRYQQVYTTSALYDNGATPNQRFMLATASYLANSVWGPAVNSVSSANYGTSDPSGKGWIVSVLDRTPWRGYEEHDSTHYLEYTIAAMETLAAYAPDSDVRNKARMVVDWGMAEAAGYWHNGHWCAPVTRGGTSGAQNAYDITPWTWLTMFGGPAPAANNYFDSFATLPFLAPQFPGVMPEVAVAGRDRTQSYTRRTFAQRSAGPQLAYFKQAWMTPKYALWSQVEGTVSGFNADGSIILANLNTTAIQDGYQGQRTGLAWDSPPGNDAMIEIKTPTTYSGTTSGISIYEDTLQREDTLILVHNIPATGGTGGNNGDWPNQWLNGHIPSGWLAITDEAASTGRIFIHYDSVLVAIYLSAPFTWTTDFTVSPWSKGAVAIETAAVTEYPQSTAAARLAAFRAAVLAAPAPDLGAINAAMPRFVYTTRHGHTLDLTYGQAGKIDGQTVDYLQWPMIEDPWMYQPQQGHLHLFGRDRIITDNYYDWTQTTNHFPTVTNTGSLPAIGGTGVDVDLAARVSDVETPATNFHFAVSAPTNGTVSLLADGHTARFTAPPDFSGAASFTFTASDRGLHPDLIWHYDFEPPATLATNSIRDAAGTTRAATVSVVGTGTATFDATTPAALGPNSTRSLHLTESGGNAARLTRLVTPANLSMTNGNWTFTTWFKRESRTTEDFIFYMGSGDGFSGNGDELQLYLPANSDALRLIHYNAANAADVNLSSPSTALTGQWHHAAITFQKTADNTGTVRLYLNGALAGTASNVTWALRQDLPIILGGHASTSTATTPRYFSGWLDDMALFRGALSNTDIASLATQSVATFGGTTVSGNVTLTVTPPTYTLTYTADPNGTLTGTSPQTVNYGATGTAITAVPNTGYHFVNWSDGSTANPRTDASITANLSVTANFAINTYTLTYTAGPNGTLTGTTPQTVNYGATGTAITAVPSTGYHFVNWSDGNTANPRTDASVTGNLSVTANFAINTYTLTYTAGPNGTLTGTSPQTVNYGASGTAVTAVPNTGYHFVNWSDGSTANPRTDTSVTANLSVTATFAINTYTLTYAAGPNGTLTGTSPQTVNYGATGTAITAVPSTGYHFVNWSDGSTANPRTDANITGNLSVTATFAINTYTLTYTAGPNGTLTGTSPQTVNYGATGTPISAVPNTGYHFVNWSDGSTANPRTDANITGNLSVTANFAINTYTLTYTAGPNGTLTGTTPQTVNYGATGTAVTAVPTTGYKFVSWSDGKTVNPRTDTNVTANITVSASFALDAPPAVPTSLTATPGNAQVALRWTVVTNATSYNVKRALVSGGPYTLIASPVSNTYTNTGLTNGTTCYYVVSAVNAAGESGNSAQVYATPSAGLPSPWATQDIGAVAATGAASYTTSTFTVIGSGADINGTADEFRFVYQLASGDCEIRARVVSVANTQAAARAGVMVRQSLTANSRNVFVAVTPSSGVTWQRRTSTGGSTTITTTSGLVAPYWVRVVRSSNTVTAYRSANGTSWTSLGSVNVNMGTSVYIGLAVTSHNDGTLCPATFDNVTAVP